MTAWWRKEEDRKDKKNLPTTKRTVLNFTCVTPTSPE
jgi:hypothetical protein